MVVLSRGQLYVVVCSLCWSWSACRTVVELSYDVSEEQPVNWLVGDVKTDAQLTELYADDVSVISRLRFTVMRQHSATHPRLFVVDALTGEVRLGARLDREQLMCHRSIVEPCVVRLDVAVRPVAYFLIIRLTINVVDINDHAPVFPDGQLSVDVVESADVGTIIGLPLAVDPDSPPLSVVEYRATAGDTDVFRLVHRRRRGSSGRRLVGESLSLELLTVVDRESVDVYQLTVVALDGGSPALTGTAQLTINVVDVNDNVPHFHHASYDVTVSEDVAPGTTLLHVTADDPDVGLNGRVIYEMASPLSSRLFTVDNTSGAVVVVAGLDCDEGPSSYQLVVSARDHPGVVSTSCVVRVQLTDVNDNRPHIVVDGLIAHSHGQSHNSHRPTPSVRS